MRIVVCVKPTLNGELNPFDGAAYEAALSVPGSEVILLSMAPEKNADFLLGLTRLGAREAVLLSDRAFAGADTLATSYALFQAIRRLAPDAVFCGRQTLEGDTGQVGPGLAARWDASFVASAMAIPSFSDAGGSCLCRGGETVNFSLPAVITFERFRELRLPSIRSKKGVLSVWTASDIEADPALCGLAGSPTRVVRSMEQQEEKRKCRMVQASDFFSLISDGLKKEPALISESPGEMTMTDVWSVGERALPMARTVCADPLVVPLDEPEKLVELIREKQPKAVLWDSLPQSKATAAFVAAKLGCGLCADCTRLLTDGERLTMIRPAFAGSVIAEIVCRNFPAMGTVRTEQPDQKELIFSLGLGARDCVKELTSLAEKHGAGLAASRGLVDKGLAPYDWQVGLTGKTVSPKVYVAFGISGAVHHLVGMKRSGTVFAVNPDPKAPIFDYADYGICMTCEDFLKIGEGKI